MSKHPDNDNLRNDIYENLPCQAMYNDAVRKIQQQKTVQSNTNNAVAAAVVNNPLSQQLLLNNISNQNAANSNPNPNTSGLTSNKQQHQQSSPQSLQQQQSNNKHYAASNMPKEMLYATPLRKSDRYKSGERLRFNSSGVRAHTAGSNHDTHDAKLSNLLEYKQMNSKELTRLCSRNGNAVPITDLDDDTALDGCSSSALVGGSHYQHQPASLPPLPNSSTPSHQLEDRRILNFLKDTTQLQKKLEVSGRDCPNASFSNLAREEHFANLMQQNFPIEAARNNGGANADLMEDRSLSTTADTSESVLTETADNLEVLMQKKRSPDKEVNGIVSTTSESQSQTLTARHGLPVYIHREWVLKKIALCLEQRTAGKKNMPGLLSAGAAGKTEAVSGFMAARAKAAAISSSTYNGCLVLGSNGSGKTSICQAIMNGNSGTKGILNRKLLACYLIESQNPECHSLSLFMRKIVLQILSHSSLITKDECQRVIDEGFSFLQEEAQQQESKLDEAMNNITLNENVEDILIAELRRGASDCDSDKPEQFQQRRTSTSNKKSGNVCIMRQKSEPTPAEERAIVNDEQKYKNYGTHPPATGNKGNTKERNEDKDNDTEKEKRNEADKEKSSPSTSSKCSPGKKSKIPVKLGRTSAIASPVKVATAITANNANTTIQQGGGEDIADMLSDELKNEIEAAINEGNTDGNKGNDEPKEKSDNEDDNEDKPEADKNLEEDLKQYENAFEKECANEEDKENCENQIDFEQGRSGESTDNYVHPSGAGTNTNTLPPPLPKPKSCRTVIADGYYELLISNPEILECLSVDNIEKNPDECFKKALLFPLLELTPPKTALLLLIDSIDENYINEGNLITTLKGGRGTTTNHKSRNVAELLSNHIHLFPKWLFLVCTTKKQTKQITRMFTGFKKITLDDLRKSHVVKDVQEYIINRLNSDFKDSIMLTKEIIESLHQLYIKSNGCILYLEKVLNGIKENFFSFREIKLIPCTLNGLYLYICQKSFNKKQYMKIRPLLNVLLASSGYVDKLFLFNCLRTHNYAIDTEEFEKRLQIMKNIVAYDADQQRLKIFHNSFSDWLVDVKFATKKFICDVNEGHVMVSMYYLLVADTLCANNVRKFVYHLIKSGEYLTSRNVNLDIILMLLESRLNLNDAFYTNHLNCCSQCENDFKHDPNFLPKTRNMIEKFLSSELSDEFSQFLCDFFKPSLPTDAKILKLLIETGINNAEAQVSGWEGLRKKIFKKLYLFLGHQKLKLILII